MTTAITAKQKYLTTTTIINNSNKNCPLYCAPGTRLDTWDNIRKDSPVFSAPDNDKTTTAIFNNNNIEQRKLSSLLSTGNRGRTKQPVGVHLDDDHNRVICDRAKFFQIFHLLEKTFGHSRTWIFLKVCFRLACFLFSSSIFSRMVLMFMPASSFSASLSSSLLIYIYSFKK